MKNSLIDYTLHLADNALILGHRNSEWCGHGPVLEQDIAITNISLDLIGQARMFYQYAAQLKGERATEDSLAYLRNPEEFKNCLLVELPKGDWALTILRQFYFSTYQLLLFKELVNVKDTQLSAIAEKSTKEVTYHVRWSGEWVIRLGDGTEESKTRIQKAITQLAPYTDELFVPAPYELSAAKENIAVDPRNLEKRWKEKVDEVFEEAGLKKLEKVKNASGGKEGRHGTDLNNILNDLQHLQRTYPGAEW